MVPPGEKFGPRWRADRADKESLKARPITLERIYMRGRDIGISRTREIPPTLVVTKKYQDVGSGSLSRGPHKSQHHDKKQISVHHLVSSWLRYPRH